MSFRRFEKEIAHITPEQALLHARPDWPTHRWGIGQNGSIAGIVYHAAAWKQTTFPLLRPDDPAVPLSEFDSGSAPPDADWYAVADWYRQIGSAWIARLSDLSESEFDAVRLFEGSAVTVSRLVTEIMEHDIQHASQVAYIRQRHRVDGLFTLIDEE